MSENLTTRKRDDDPPSPTGDTFLSVPPNREAPGLARAFVKRRMRELGMPELTGDAALVASEPVTNAAREQADHFPTEPIVVRLILTSQGRPRFEVTDCAPGSPRRRNVSSEAETGRGLALVSAVARRWDFARRPGGVKTVWAEL
ncbi:ATP-binding protein [Thermomonospora catenispora]|uniref:ATP-binding protein n=1 Tax=Thermomonospora catenispora TaxID=2493090 RepID=UPI00240D5C7B|nr:ATP-binding protein [Thermomonospora catenispora]